MSDLSIDLIGWKDVNIRNFVLFWAIAYLCVSTTSFYGPNCFNCQISLVGSDRILLKQRT